MSGWAVEYADEAAKDMKRLDHSQQILVIKAIGKVSANPLPNSEGGYGKSLGNHLTGNLTGFLKIKLRSQGLRVVYQLIHENSVMRIIVISVRDDGSVYRMTVPDKPNSKLQKYRMTD